MHCKIHNSIHVKIYEEIVRGKLRPHLPIFDNVENLTNLVKQANHRKVLFISSEENPDQAIRETDFTVLGYRYREDYKIIKKENYLNKNIEIFIEPSKCYELKELIDIPNFVSIKANSFVELIGDEFERIKIRADKVLELIDDHQKFDLYAKKNILKTKKIYKEARILLKELQKEDDLENFYIIFVLCLFLIRTITFYKEHFKFFFSCDIRSEAQMTSEFYKEIFLSDPSFFINNRLTKYCVREKKSSQIYTDDTEENTPSTASIRGKTFSEIQQSSEGVNEVNTYSPIEFKLNGQINVLIDVILQLKEASTPEGESFIEISNNEIRDFLVNHVTDKFGNKLSFDSISTLLKPSRIKKLIKKDNPKRINLDHILSPKKFPN
jgi:hypothetical protein